MRTYPDCYPCLARNAVEAARLTTVDEGRQTALVQKVLRRLAEARGPHTPVRLSAEVHALIREELGVADPYARLKAQANRRVLAIRPALRRRLAAAEDRLNTAVRMAIAGNIIDHGSLGEAFDLAATLERCLGAPLAIDDYDGFRRRLDAARRVVYVADNAGEIVLDGLLIEEMQRRAAVEVVLVVRGSPILNDVTAADAAAVGLDRRVRVVAAGAGAPGCELERSPAEVGALFAAADLIVAKGQGNYEALSEAPHPVFFLLQVKCPVIAADIGGRKGDSVLKQSQRKGVEDPCRS
jgi:hypothetical protein